MIANLYFEENNPKYQDMAQTRAWNELCVSIWEDSQRENMEACENFLMSTSTGPDNEFRKVLRNLFQQFLLRLPKNRHPQQLCFRMWMDGIQDSKLKKKILSQFKTVTLNKNSINERKEGRIQMKFSKHNITVVVEVLLPR